MGIKDNPRRIRHTITAATIGGMLITGGYLVVDKNSIIKDRDEAIQQYMKKMDEQGSQIDQLQTNVDDLSQRQVTITDENNELKHSLEKQDASIKKQKDTIKSQKKELETKDDSLRSKDSKIAELEEELAFKRAKAKRAAVAEASTSSSTIMPSRGSEPSGRTITVESTGYVAMCTEGCTGITATGMNLKDNPNAKVIAVDPSVIPLGTKVYVPGYGYAVAADTGGAINGHKIDVHMPSTSAALSWGRRTIQVKILD